jgi:sugar/nucleoside kinase (ribokinase family)
MIDAILIGQLLEEDIVVVEIIQGNLKLLATSIYLDAENEISRDLNKIENIIQFAKGRGLLVAMDSNARSKTWHDVLTNRRGRLLEEFLISNWLHIVNEESEFTMFESNRSSSNVDLTVVDSTIVTLINKWQCNEHESYSDHRYITFRIEKRKAITNYTHVCTHAHTPHTNSLSVCFDSLV